MESPPEEDFCSICHDSFTLPCQANCSHWFCGHCILRVWHHGSALQPCKCPICRRFITLLIPTDAAVQERQDPEASRVLENIEKYNRNFGGGSSSLIQINYFGITEVEGPSILHPKAVKRNDGSTKVTALRPQSTSDSCCHCILRVWHHGSALQPCKCPICRRFITLLIPTDAAVQERQDPEASRVLENIEKYNRNFGGGSSSLIQRLRDLPFFIRRLLREMMDPQRSLPFVLRVRVILAMALSAIYVLSPVDIIPEGVFGFVGFLDDLIILLIVFLHLATVYRSVLLYRHGDGQHQRMVKERTEYNTYWAQRVGGASAILI
ncbi:hypothetical protein C4D60_Mb07t04320 [Musa balbisiana]|uniref:E3 ubiquitin-protein ligase RNF170 n=1 Tax=Musa balbisiana TaxID=52838 RepID=A0A4S8JFE5_MUSBA|nr:hypothetical protein C4D60_Mb07t04320 [Musa balbisiana]